MRVTSLLYVLPLVAAAIANQPRDPRRHLVAARAAELERGILDGIFPGQADSSTTTASSASQSTASSKTTGTPTAAVLPPPPVMQTSSSSSAKSSTTSSTTGDGLLPNPLKPSSSDSSSSSSVSDSSSSSSPSTAPSSSASSLSSSDASSSGSSSASSSASPSSSASSESSPSPSPTEGPTSEESSSTSDNTREQSSASYSTNAQGHVETVFVEVTASATADSSASNKKGDEGLSKGAIIGIAVGSAAGGIALIAGVIFLLTRRRNEPGGEAILWPELNHHGDPETHHALPVRSGSNGGSRMSLGEELDGPPAMYYSEKSYEGYPESQDPHELQDVHGPALNGSAFGGTANFSDYEHQYPTQPHQDSFYEPSGEDYSNMPPPVQPRTSPVQAAYEWDHSAPDPYDGYSGMHRQESPPMTGVGAGAAPVSFNPAGHHGQY